MVAKKDKGGGVVLHKSIAKTYEKREESSHFFL